MRLDYCMRGNMDVEWQGDSSRCDWNLDLFINQISDYALFMLDSAGYVRSWNVGAEKLKGYAAQEIIGKHFSVFYTAEDIATGKPCRALDIASRNGTYQEEGVRVRKDGTRFCAMVTITALRDKRGELQGFAKLTRDITERRKMEEALRRSEERFRLLYENAPVGIAHLDLSGRITFANGKLAEILGYTPDEIIGLSYIDVTPPEEREISTELIGQWLSGQIDTIHRERPILRKDGSTAWIRLTARTLRDELGERQYGIAIFEDITERKRAEEVLRQSEEKFRATFEHAPLGIAECSLEGRFISVNTKLLDLLGYTAQEMQHFSVLDVTHGSDMEETLANLQKLAGGEVDSALMEKRYIRKDRSLVWVRVTTALRRIDGKPNYFIAAIEDITARKQAEEDLKKALDSSHYQATHDMLTGLANRAQFNSRLKEALAYAQRDEHLVAIHFLDLDRFKSINDTLGHHVGDLLLQEAAKRIKSHVRSTDMAARLGGDEFAIIQTHLAEPTAAGVLAGKLVEELGRMYVLDGQDVQSGVSLGIALYPNDAEDADTLIKQADLALYDAKHRGRFNYQFYREELGVAFQQARHMEQALVRGLKKNEFCVHYQPQFDLKNGKITGIEALLRWQNPAKGMITAADFIQEAERANLMLPIGEWALRVACRQHKEWIGSGLAVPLTLNVSAKQFRHPRFMKILQRILVETELPPTLLQLEMRESVLWDPKFSMSPLNEMKDYGVLLSIDDFGAELTALSSLEKYPLNTVKPGRRLIRELPLRQRETAVLAAIVGVARDLKITVCAEGVETAAQLGAVRDQGCDFAQGYFLSSPLDANAMSCLVARELFH